MNGRGTGQLHNSGSRRTWLMAVGTLLFLLLYSALPLPAQEELVATPAPPPRWQHDVTQPPYLADPTGASDATAAFRRAIADAISVTRQGGHATLVVPEGRFLLSGTLSLGADELAARRFHLRGAGPQKTTLFLKENCGTQTGEDNFQDPANPRPVLTYLEGNYSEVALGNTLEDVAIKVGAGNPGAIGLVFHTSLYGAVRNVHLMAAGPSRTGLVLGRRMAGPGVLNNVIISGFAQGLLQDDGESHAYGFAVGNLAILEPTEAAIISERRLLAVRNLMTSGTAPILKSANPSGLGVITSINGAKDAPWPEDKARYESAGLLSASDPTAADPRRLTVLPKETPSPWETAAPKPEEQPAAVPLDPDAMASPTAQVVSVPSPGPGADASAALQAALDAGATTLELPDAVYVLEHPLRLPPTLSVLRGNWSALRPAGALLLEAGRPVLEICGGTAPSLLIERIDSQGVGNGGFVWIEHTAERKVVLRDMVLSGGAGAYVGAGTGSLELENMAYTSAAKPTGEPAWLIQGQQVRALGWTVFADFPHIANDGGDLEATGLFLGNQHGPYLLNINGARTKFHGAFAMALKQGGIPPSLPAFVNDSSDLELSLLEHSTARLGYDQFYESGGHSVLIREFRAGESREILKEDALPRAGDGLTGSALARYASHLRDAAPANAAVSVSVPGGAEFHEGETVAVRFQRQGDLEKPLKIYYQLEGDAGGPDDLDSEKLTGSLEFPAGQAAHELPLPILADGEEEPAESVIIRLNGGPGYRMLYGRHAVRFSVLDLPPQGKAGVLAHYPFTGGQGLDDSGHGNHAQIHHAGHVTDGGTRYALTFSGQAQWVEISPTQGKEPAPAPEPTAPAPSAPEPKPADHVDPIIATAEPQPGSALFADRPAAPPQDPLEAALESLRPGTPSASAPPAPAAASFLHEPFAFRSVVLRFRADDTTRFQTLYEEGGRDNGFSLTLRRGDVVFTVAAAGKVKSITAAVDPKIWTHVVAVYDAGALRLYLDGRLWNEGTAEFTQIPADPSGAALAATLDGGPECPSASYFKGIIGDVSIYGKSLKLNDAKQLFVGSGP